MPAVTFHDSVVDSLTDFRWDSERRTLATNSARQYQTRRHRRQLRVEQYSGNNVVVDVEAPFVYLGRLEAVREKTVVLEYADVHDLRDSTTTREQYVLDAKVHGIQENRRRVAIRMDRIVSISLLEDVIA